jgi:hypothetical protein
VKNELMKSNFAKFISSVFYECDERWVNPEDIKSILISYGFTSFLKVGTGYHYGTMASKNKYLHS